MKIPDDARVTILITTLPTGKRGTGRSAEHRSIRADQARQMVTNAISNRLTSEVSVTTEPAEWNDGEQTRYEWAAWRTPGQRWTSRPWPHDAKCVCSPYDRCWGVRVEDARRSGNPLDRHRAYND